MTHPTGPTGQAASPFADTRIVLVRPQRQGNIGSAARVMANLGLHRLVLVAPQTDPFGPDARRMSARADHLLLRARVVDRLEDALAGVALTVATTCRTGAFRSLQPIPPRELSARVREAPGPAAILFGPEDQGLTNDDLLRCDATLSIATSSTYPSLNLAQSVAIVAYELTEAGRAPAAGPPSRPGRSEPADGVLLAEMIERFRRPLARIGYLDPQKPDKLLRALRVMTGRARLNRQEAQILIGLAQQIDRFADEAEQGGRE